jgi:GT2 family glycosyltransferase
MNETTKPCLESIYTCKTNIDFETVVVDNLSTDGTRDYLISIRNKYKNLHVIFNNQNYGYAKGNNIGIRSTSTDYYVLLNSDTIITDYWVDKFVRFLEHHPETGIVGPVSNSVGCAQRIYCKGITQDEILSEGKKWSKLCEGDFFFMDMLGFFCVCIRKEVFEAIGLLDEQFGIGMFEDDDFCLRTQQKGYKMACLEDVFIFHKGSFSFKKLDQDFYNRLLLENASKFEKKHHKKWYTHERPSAITSLINIYLEENRDNPDKLTKKIANKIQVIDSIEIVENIEHIKLNERLKQNRPFLSKLKKTAKRIIGDKNWKKLKKYLYRF